MEKQTQCPNCQAYKVKVNSKSKNLIIGMACIVTAVILYWISVTLNTVGSAFLLPAAFAFIIVGIIKVGYSFFQKATKVFCLKCGFKFELPNR